MNTAPHRSARTGSTTGDEMSWHRWAKVVPSAIALTVTCLVATTCSPATASPRVDLPALRWSPCAARFQCGVLAVPLDYDAPRGKQIDIAMIRRPADEPRRRLGTIVVNPGGPGVSGVDLVYSAAATLFPPDVLVRFDIVGFDPRGVARTVPLHCSAHPDDPTPRSGLPSFPVGPEQTAATVAAARAYARLCARNGGEILAHMGTADTARDVDRMRQAMGERRINFAGYSYGTELGVTYAAMFPGHLRALVLDGVVDPREWAGTPRAAHSAPSVLEQRMRSGDGAQAALAAFFRACDAAGPAACAIAGRAKRTYDEVALALRDEASAPSAPLVPASDGSPGDASTVISYAEFIATVLQSLYDGSSLVALARGIDGVHDALVAAGGPPALVRVGGRRLPVARGGVLPAPVYNEDALLGVLCADVASPRDPRSWAAAAHGHDSRAPGFADLWVYNTLPCAFWPRTSDDRFAGPFAPPAARVGLGALVVSTTEDPATRYAAGVAVAALLPRARLLTLHGFGHTSGGSSQCVERAVARYLIVGTTSGLPRSCEQDLGPFESDPLGTPAGVQLQLGRRGETLRWR